MLVVKATAFFRAVSHQLYGDPNNHLLIRQAGVQYLSYNPERFIESNIDNSWIEYMSGFLKTVWKNLTIALSGRFSLARNYLQSRRYKN